MWKIGVRRIRGGDRRRNSREMRVRRIRLDICVKMYLRRIRNGDVSRKNSTLDSCEDVRGEDTSEMCAGRIWVDSEC